MPSPRRLRVAIAPCRYLGLTFPKPSGEPAVRVRERGRERGTPEVAALRCREPPELERQMECVQLPCEGERPAREHGTVIAADRDVEPDTRASQRRRVAFHGERGIVRAEVRGCRVHERS